jgi:hypothetical protein
MGWADDPTKTNAYYIHPIHLLPSYFFSPPTFFFPAAAVVVTAEGASPRKNENKKPFRMGEYKKNGE